MCLNGRYTLYEQFGLCVMDNCRHALRSKAYTLSCGLPERDLNPCDE